ncbi:MAG: hypothetical protein AABP62_14015 [Planctomycetota bacterium]
MRKSAFVLLIVLLAAVIGPTVFVNAQQADQPKPDSEVAISHRKIPVIIQRVFLPSTSDDVPAEKVSARLDEASDYEPGDDVAATLIGAKLAGWAAGYEFLPVETVKAKAKPKDILDKTASDANEVLLIRVSTRTSNFGQGSIVFVMADVALLRRPSNEVITQAGFVAAAKIDPAKIEGDKVKADYWLKTVATIFAQEFDRKMLAKVQDIHDRKQIDDAISKLSEKSDVMPISVAVEQLEGTKDRKPELQIRSDIKGTAYLVPKEKGKARRWSLGGVGDVNVTLDPGDYLLHIDLLSVKSRASTLHRSELKVESSKLYKVATQ